MVVTRFLDPKEDASAGRFRPAPYSSLAYRLSCYTSLCINIITDLPVGIQYPAHFTRPCTVIRRRYICAGAYKIFLVEVVGISSCDSLKLTCSVFGNIDHDTSLRSATRHIHSAALEGRHCSKRHH